MENIEWKEVEPQQKDWERQIDIMFCEICMVGSIVYFGEECGWGCVIDGAVDVLLARTEEEAKKEIVEVIISNCDDAIAHYAAIKESIDQLNFSGGTEWE